MRSDQDVPQPEVFMGMPAEDEYITLNLTLTLTLTITLILIPTLG